MRAVEAVALAPVEAHHEYRVIWRRRAWRSHAPDRVTVFADRALAEAFVAELRQPWVGSPLVLLRLEHRAVGAWRDVPVGER